MSNFRNKLKEKFSPIPNDLIFDNTISDRARFVYVYMASKPANWDFYMHPMAKELNYSVETLRKHIIELINNGWVTRVGQKRNDCSQWGAVSYILEDVKINIPDTGKTRHGKNPTREKPCTEKPDTGKTRHRKNPTLNNTDNNKNRLFKNKDTLNSAGDPRVESFIGEEKKEFEGSFNNGERVDNDAMLSSGQSIKYDDALSEEAPPVAPPPPVKKEMPTFEQSVEKLKKMIDSATEDWSEEKRVTTEEVVTLVKKYTSNIARQCVKASLSVLQTPEYIRGEKNVLQSIISISDELYEENKYKEQDKKEEAVIKEPKRRNNYELFEKFWLIYDKQVGRIATENLFYNLTNEQKDQVMAHVESYVKSTPDKKYRMNPSSYLKGRRFTDEIIKTEKKSDVYIESEVWDSKLQESLENSLKNLTK